MGSLFYNFTFNKVFKNVLACLIVRNNNGIQKSSHTFILPTFSLALPEKISSSLRLIRTGFFIAYYTQSTAVSTDALWLFEPVLVAGNFLLANYSSETEHDGFCVYKGGLDVSSIESMLTTNVEGSWNYHTILSYCHWWALDWIWVKKYTALNTLFWIQLHCEA